MTAFTTLRQLAKLNKSKLHQNLNDYINDNNYKSAFTTLRQLAKLNKRFNNLYDLQVEIEHELSLKQKKTQTKPCSHS